MSLTHKALRYILIACLLIPGYLFAVEEEEELLMPEQAFPAEIVSVDSETISIKWSVADKYYLYRSKFRFIEEQDAIELDEAILPPGKIKHDEFFGEVETYRGDVTIKVPYTVTGKAPASFTLTAISQGCADLGVCYPPHKQNLQVDIPVTQASTLSIPNPIAALSNFGKSLGLGGSSDDDFLEPDQAFQLVATSGEDGTVRLDFTVAEAYYLYRDKIKVSIADHPENIKLGEVSLPIGKIKRDEYFGDVSVYYEGTRVYVPVINTNQETRPFKLLVQYQGCADAGLCYPPIKKSFDLNAPPTPVAATKKTAEPVIVKADKPLTQETKAAAPVVDTQSADAEPVAEQDKLARILLEKPLWFSALVFFAIGITLAFTPCVFPMIPILSGIIIGQGEKLSTRKAFSLSLVYVLAMAVTYTVAGVVAGLFGANLQAAFQDPWVVSTFVALFVVLSFSMFGFYELQMPTAIQSRLTEISNSQQGGTLVGVGIMGFLSALIVGPCVTAPLIGALIVIGQTGDAVLGGTALFALSMGMGAPLLAIGASAGKLLPKAGPWMDTIKAVFGVGLLAVALWLLERIIPGPAGLFLWAVLFIVSAIYMGAMDSLPDGVSGWRRLWKGVGIIVLIWGVLMVIGASTGSRDMLNPLKNLNSGSGGGTSATSQAHLNFTRIKTVDDFKKQLADANARGQYVMLDFYADWCVYCIQMEERTFPDAGVQRALSNVHLLQADVTANDDQDTALLKHFSLIAPPAILFFDPKGKERKNYRVVGFKDAKDFNAHLAKALK
ncbi:MAG: protein-disulfide reductase DsbD [Gammaproteobacteria bacterium]|nr:protein-disulfide reductase DsbD [Gammaproteobacteria bacterium]